MLAAAPHRGSSTVIRAHGNCVLGIAHRPGATDASISADGDIVAALSGRLDNVQELGRELRALGSEPASSNDADVIVAAFRTLGADAPNRMRGSFAAIVTDGRSLWCFRDHLGFRPLFYRDDPHAFVVASESRQVAIGAQLREEPDFDVLVRIMFERMPANTPAALKGVERLPQANTLTMDPDKGVRLHRYWHPLSLIESARYTLDEATDRFVALMAQAVARTITGKDVILLSGGLDSPSVAAFAAPEHKRRTGQPIGALSAVFPDLPAVDERQYIELVAERFGIELHTHRPSSRALDDVEKWCRLFGTPVPIVSVPELASSHTMAANLGYETVLTGDFAEFTFGSPMHVVGHLLTRGRWQALTRLLKAERKRGANARHLAEELLSVFVPGTVANWYLRWRGLDWPERIPNWLDAKKVNEVPFRTDLVPLGPQRWLHAQRSGLEGSTITMEADEICGAMAGVTIRRPFADIDLWEFFLSLRAELKCPDLRFKTLVKGMMRGRLPDEILDRRRKTVFDDHVMKQVDYPTLTRLLVRPRHRIPGVNYELLAERIEQRAFNRFDWHWSKDLAVIHAFLSAW